MSRILPLCASYRAICTLCGSSVSFQRLPNTGSRKLDCVVMETTPNKASQVFHVQSRAGGISCLVFHDYIFIGG